VQIEETFNHYSLHRLSHASHDGMPLHNGLPFSTTIDETYDSVGNRIDTLRDGKLSEHRNYGSNAQQPYALTERDVSDPANPNQPPQALMYQYDELGRLQQDPHRTLKWNAFDLPWSVTQDGQTWTFLYGAYGERAKKSGPDETITYLAGLYEKHEGSHATRHVFHVLSSDGPVADVIYSEDGSSAVQYPLSDALGSTYAIADANGTVAERDYYDVWGLRSNPDGTPLENLPLFQSLSSSGFTDQEHDDDLVLINMQGRMYDPALGRFLSPDPLVGNPAFSQSWNSYSYVLNSPLNFTDPSGLDPCPPGFYCTTGPGNEITNTIQTGGGNGAFDGDGGAGNAGSVTSAVVGAFAMMQDLKKLAQQQHEIEVRTGQALSDGTRIRAADGTPILPRRYNAQSQLVDNWGTIRIYPNSVDKNPPLNYTDNRAVKYVGNFEKRLFCGSKCSEASAPTSAREAANAPKQLSSARIARNALSQALAARALVKRIGKVGVVVDEGVDGLMDNFMPEPPQMSDQDRKFARALKKAMAVRRYEASQQKVAAAMENAAMRMDRVQNAFDDLGNTTTPVTDDLGDQVFAGNMNEYEKAGNALDAALEEEEHALNLMLGLDDE
jgi:RHS repeat-associated protein